MFSMTNADELRERALQSRKHQPSNEAGPVAANSSKSEREIQAPAADAAGSTGKTPEEPSAKEFAPNFDFPDDIGMTEEQIEEFFRTTTERLTSPEEREKVKEQVRVKPDTRITALLIGIQQEQLEAMGIEKEVGQKALNVYARTTAMKDETARAKVDAFDITCKRTYIEVLRDMRPDKEETEAKMTAGQIMEFFEACDTLMALPETKEQLRKECLETKKPPDETIVGMQRSMLRTLGIEPDHGVSCLNSFAQDYPDNQELQQRLQQFMMCASMAQQEAMLGKEEFLKMRQLYQESLMKQHQMATELAALDKKGRQELTKRVEAMQQKHAVAISVLTTADEKKAYMKSIPAEEQWEIAKLRMLTMKQQAETDGGHGHSHAHGQPCTGRDHGHGHGHRRNAPNDMGSHGGHSHNHNHGPGCSHDRAHQHAI